MNEDKLIKSLLDFSSDIRYVAVYRKEKLTSKQKERLADSSGLESDKYEELLVNPTLLTLVRQRGNIDCGGLRYILIAYGNFYQLINEIVGGHISVCLSKRADLANLPQQIFDFIENR